MTEEIQKDTLTGRQLKAALLTAEDLTTDHEIAWAVGVRRNSLARWKRLPEFQVAVEKYRRELEAAILKSGASKVHRIRRMNKRWQELHEIAAQRASEAKTPESLMHGIAGAETGWVVAKETEVIGKKGEERLQVVEVEVDTALL